jgi:iron complex transport system permease protein
MKRPYLLNTLLLCLALVLSVGIGAVFIPPASIARFIFSAISFQLDPAMLSDTLGTIVLQLRLPHTILIALAGTALAASGAAYQGLFQNPLADPYLLGVASGAGLGAVLAMSINWPGNMLSFFSIPVAAFVGAATTVLLVYRLARFGNVLSTTNLILAGVAVGSFASALTSFIMLRSEGEVRRAIAWLLGGSTLTGWAPVLASLPYIFISLSLLIASGHGIIGFVGLIVPHLIRILWGPDYRRLIPLSILGGATTLLIADLLARTLMAPQVLPVGIITALAGAPFFIWVLRRYQRGEMQI